jgi:hypothetical protein
MAGRASLVALNNPPRAKYPAQQKNSNAGDVNRRWALGNQPDVPGGYQEASSNNTMAVLGALHCPPHQPLQFWQHNIIWQHG